jgi:hypothetical protein
MNRYDKFVAKYVKPYAKGIVAFVAPGVVSVVAAVQDGSPGGSAVTGPEWIGIGAACLLTAAGVGGVKNTPYVDPEG